MGFRSSEQFRFRLRRHMTDTPVRPEFVRNRHPETGEAGCLSLFGASKGAAASEQPLWDSLALTQSAQYLPT